MIATDYQLHPTLKKFFFVTCLAGALIVNSCKAPMTTSGGGASVAPVASNGVPCDRFQQRAEYTMDVDFDHLKHQYHGKQHLVYYNNSGDELKKVFYHLYPNAFQPGSAMDVRSRTISDPDGRVGSRISKLKADEIGYLRVTGLTLNGKKCGAVTEGTILEVSLPEGIAPGSKVVFDLEFDGQVPVQIRRSGRNNMEGVDYSMAQWYPALCEYDEQGWHSDPYIAREFYGIWGDFDVTIHLDERYTIGASGILQNPLEIGKGYETAGAAVKRNPMKGKLAWHFKAQNVHDFMWAADPDYVHKKMVADDGTLLHFIYIESAKTKAVAQLPSIMAKAFGFASQHYGKYPYSDFYFIQGGDGGMEYPMSTLIRMEGKLEGLVNVSVHESLHSWYQGVLGSNESLYPWMDEGFTTFAENHEENYVKSLGLIPGETSEEDPMLGHVRAYCNFALSGKEEALSTHADHYMTNRAYSMASYVKGAVFLQQIQYIVGEETFNKGLLRYWDTWKFKHPNANDVIRVFEKQSGLELDWFKEYFVNTTHTIDYGVKSVESEGGTKTKIVLERVGVMPMPMDVEVTYTDGRKEMFYIPLDIQRGDKANEHPGEKFSVCKRWQWVNPSYELEIAGGVSGIKSVVIDPSGRLADVKLENNVWRGKE